MQTLSVSRGIPDKMAQWHHLCEGLSGHFLFSLNCDSSQLIKGLSVKATCFTQDIKQATNTHTNIWTLQSVKRLQNHSAPLSAQCWIFFLDFMLFSFFSLQFWHVSISDTDRTLTQKRKERQHLPLFLWIYLHFFKLHLWYNLILTWSPWRHHPFGLCKSPHQTPPNSTLRFKTVVTAACSVSPLQSSAFLPKAAARTKIALLKITMVCAGVGGFLWVRKEYTS